MYRMLPLLLLIVCAVDAADDRGENLIGRQSQNEGLLVLPAPGMITIDGELSDWDLSARIWCFADIGVRERYSVQVSAMWDAEHLYLAARWCDPTPMRNLVDPAYNPNEGWKSDCWQMRMMTDQLNHATAWYSTPQQQPSLHLSHNKGGAGDYDLFVAKPGEVDLGHGARMAFRKDADGAGYVQELCLPWTLLWAKLPAIEPGLVFRLGNEFLWGNQTARDWPGHRYADNMQAGQISREFFWSKDQIWGDARLVAKGGVEPRRYIEAGSRLQGSVPVRLHIPANATRFTVAIDDAKGRRVRNLAGDFDPEIYAVGEDGATRTVEVLWDCLDDHGQPVSPGTYTMRGLSHAGLDATYQQCFYNPGTPAWSTTDGTGAWGADHNPPVAVAASGDGMFIGWEFPEGGDGVIRLNADGRKLWGDKHGGKLLCADTDHVYVISDTWYVTSVLVRLSVTDGSPAPFVDAGNELPFELDVRDVLRAAGAEGVKLADKLPESGKKRSAGSSGSAAVTAMAIHGDALVLAFSTGHLALLDAGSARLRQLLHPGTLRALASDGGKRLYGLHGDAVVMIDIKTGDRKTVPTDGIGDPVAITVDGDGQIVVLDMGPDRQAKAFNAQTGGAPLYRCGRLGGRPLRGTWDPTGMRYGTSVAVDVQGQVWVTEHSDYPRRVSVWNREGTLVRDFIGNTAYAGSGVYLDERDPTLAYVEAVELRLDPATRTNRVQSILWVPDETKGEAFPLTLRTKANYSVNSMIYSDASGTEHRYLHSYDNRGGWLATYMPQGDCWQPVAAICKRSALPATLRNGAFANVKDEAGIFWNDDNGNAVVEREECEIVPGGIPVKGAMTDWGRRMGTDLSMYANPATRYRPIGFTAQGAPRYGSAGMVRLSAEIGDLVPVDAENRLLCLSFTGFPKPTTGMLGMDLESGQIQWSYPNNWPSVQGSHRAPMPRPGRLIGPLKICGVAPVDGLGRVFVLRGNLGQDFFFTTDGLFVGALFQDGRLPSETLPDTEEELIGRSLAGLSLGGEPFNGWFGRQADGHYRLTTGFARQAGMIVDVTGLEGVRRFDDTTLQLDAATITRALADNAARSAAAEDQGRYTIARLAMTLEIDGDLKEWSELGAIEVATEGSPTRAKVRIAHDGKHLLVAVEAADVSPWRNHGTDPTRLFKTGDAVDLQLGPAAGWPRNQPGASDLRLMFAHYGDHDVAVLMRPTDPSAPPSAKVTYSSPVGGHDFDRVEILKEAVVVVQIDATGYRLEASVPLAALGLAPGQALRADVGLIASDDEGTINTARIYWRNKATNHVNDLPHESWLYPAEWGEWLLAK